MLQLLDLNQKKHKENNENNKKKSGKTGECYRKANNNKKASLDFFLLESGRIQVVTEAHSKCVGLCPRRFKSCRPRFLDEI